MTNISDIHHRAIVVSWRIAYSSRFRCRLAENSPARIHHLLSLTVGCAHRDKRNPFFSRWISPKAEHVQTACPIFEFHRHFQFVVIESSKQGCNSRCNNFSFLLFNLSLSVYRNIFVYYLKNIILILKYYIII